MSGQYPTAVNGIPYAEWVARKTAKSIPATAQVEHTPPPAHIEPDNDDLDLVKTALGLDDDVHIIDVLNAISELMAIADQHRSGDTGEDRLTSITSDDETYTDQKQGTGGPEYIDLGDGE